MRAGAVTIGMLAEGVRVQIMRAMAGGFNALSVPEDYGGAARPQGSAGPRAAQRSDREAGEPADPEYERKYAITPAGRARLPVADSIELWLLKAPGGLLPYEDRRSRESIMLLSEAWGLGIAHRLAIGPASARDLIEAAGMPRRRAGRLLKALRRVGLIEAGAEAGDAYAPTDWLRRAVAPILRAAEVEHYDPPSKAEPFDALDFEAALLLAAPLANREQGRSGRCRLVARLGDPGRREPVGVTVELEDGAVLACERGLAPDTPAESTGLPTAWFRALSEQRPSLLRYDGDKRLGRELVAALAWVLFDEQAYVR